MSLKSKCEQYDTLVNELLRIIEVIEQPTEYDQSDTSGELDKVLNLLKMTMEDEG